MEADPVGEADRWMQQQIDAAEQEMADIDHAADLALAGPVQAYTKAVLELWRGDSQYMTAEQYLHRKRQTEYAQTAISSALHDLLISAGLPEDLCEQVSECARAIIGTNHAKRIILLSFAPQPVTSSETVVIEDDRPF